MPWRTARRRQCWSSVSHPQPLQTAMERVCTRCRIVLEHWSWLSPSYWTGPDIVGRQRTTVRHGKLILGSCLAMRGGGVYQSAFRDPMSVPCCH